MAKFNVGDIVKVVGTNNLPYHQARHCGWTQGMDKYIDGKYIVEDTLDGSNGSWYQLDIPYPYPYPFHEDTLKPVEIKHKLSVTIPENCYLWTDGKTVRLTDKRSGERAEATCAPEDEFNLKTGIRIAYKRLKKKISETYLNCEVVCTETGYDAHGNTLFERGKMYTFKNGVIEKCENGQTYPFNGNAPYKELDDGLKRFFVKVEQEHPEAPSEFKDPYSTCTFIALKDHDKLRAGHVYHVQDHAARDDGAWRIVFDNNEIGYLQASKIVQVIKEG